MNRGIRECLCDLLTEISSHKAVRRLEENTMNNELTDLNPFKHTPTLDISTWYKGILSTQLATDENTGGAFDLVLANMKRGTEPHLTFTRRNMNSSMCWMGHWMHTLTTRSSRLDQGNVYFSLCAGPMHFSFDRPRSAC